MNQTPKKNFTLLLCAKWSSMYVILQVRILPLFKPCLDQLKQPSHLRLVSARLWMPDLMKEYTNLQAELLAINSLFKALFPDSPFCAFTMNMGPHTVCIGHRDLWNVVYGTCPIGALGPFNHRTGGHIILHEPKVIIEFRRGDVIFIPSAAVTHENAPILDGEARYSFTMYSAGGLFCYAWCGMRTLKEVREADKALYEKYIAEGTRRWEEGWKKYSTIDDLISRTKCSSKE